MSDGRILFGLDPAVHRKRRYTYDPQGRYLIFIAGKPSFGMEPLLRDLRGSPHVEHVTVWPHEGEALSVNAWRQGFLAGTLANAPHRWGVVLWGVDIDTPFTHRNGSTFVVDCLEDLHDLLFERGS